MRVIHRLSDDPTVVGGNPHIHGRLLQAWKRRIDPRLRNLQRRGFRTGNPVIHSTAWPDTGLGLELERSDADVVHLHWLGDATISIEEIGRLRKPLVWTLHDQWAFCGAEHRVSLPLGIDERFAEGYVAGNRPAHEAGPDLNRRTWQRKRSSWRRPIQIIGPSRWMADCARRSPLMAGWPVAVIPLPIDLSCWAPVAKREARALLGLPQDVPLVLFGADGGTTNPSKGADLLCQALQCLRDGDTTHRLENVRLVVVGQSQPSATPEFPCPVHWAGRFHDDISLRLHYAAADLTVVPSRHEAFGQMASESQACGTPVVAFRSSGLMDVVEDRVTGALAEPFDPHSLAAAIAWLLEEPTRRVQLGAAARQRAERLWEPARIAGMYGDLYRGMLEN
jgi:glycosyltransferase involved in cell wall biosynthesis